MSRYGWTLAALLALTPAAACADPGYYVVTAYDNAGRAFVGFRYWTVKAHQRSEQVCPKSASASHRWRPGLHVGAQGFGELGRWNDWAPWHRQSHRAGPAVFSDLALAGGQTLKLQAAWLTGKTFARRGHMFTGRVVLAF